METDDETPIRARQQPTVRVRRGGAYDRYAGLIVGVESECAAAATVGARLGLEMAAVLFCTDNAKLPRESDQRYGGLADGRVCRAFEAGLEAVVSVLSSNG